MAWSWGAPKVGQDEQLAVVQAQRREVDEAAPDRTPPRQQDRYREVVPAHFSGATLNVRSLAVIKRALTSFYPWPAFYPR